jgi:hypothetical protein
MEFLVDDADKEFERLKTPSADGPAADNDSVDQDAEYFSK